MTEATLTADQRSEKETISYLRNLLDCKPKDPFPLFDKAKAAKNTKL